MGEARRMRAARVDGRQSFTPEWLGSPNLPAAHRRARWEMAVLPFTPDLMRERQDVMAFGVKACPDGSFSIDLSRDHKEPGLRLSAHARPSRDGRWYVMRRGQRRYLDAAEVVYRNGREYLIRFRMAPAA